MTMNLGKNMVRLRIIRTEEEDDARILAYRKQRIRSRVHRSWRIGGADVAL